MKNNICLTKKKEFIELFEEMIDYMVMYNEDVYTDDMIVDLTADPEKRQEAFETLLEWLQADLGYESEEK